MQAPTDPVERFLNGDPAAFREIVETHQARIRGLIAYMGLRAADVDDVAQDTFIHVYEHIREYTVGTNLSAWIKAIARYKALAFLEAARREARHRQDALEDFLMAATEPPDETATEDESLMDRMMRCLNRMDEQPRSLLKAHYSGTPIKDLARRKGHSKDAMKMLLFRLRTALKRCVEAHP